MEENIESIGIIIRTKDNRTKEIPLEVWQVGAITEVLGLQVRLPDLDDYQMCSKEVYEQRKKEELCITKYFGKTVKTAITKVLCEYKSETRQAFYAKSDEEIAKIYEQLKQIQEEFGLSKAHMKDLVEDTLR